MRIFLVFFFLAGGSRRINWIIYHCVNFRTRMKCSHYYACRVLSVGFYDKLWLLWYHVECKYMNREQEILIREWNKEGLKTCSGFRQYNYDNKKARICRSFHFLPYQRLAKCLDRYLLTQCFSIHLVIEMVYPALVISLRSLFFPHAI